MTDASPSSAATWVFLCKQADCPPGGSLELVAADRMVALFNVDGAFHALDGVCPHQGGPLGKGKLVGRTVTCPWHGWQFDVSTGCNKVASTIVQPCFPLELRGDEVWIGVS